MRQGRRRTALRRNTPAIIRSRPHLENQFPAGHDLFVAEVNLVEWLAVQGCALNVGFLRTVSPGDDAEGFSVVQPEHCLVKQRAADEIIRVTGADGIKSERAEGIQIGRASCRE